MLNLYILFYFHRIFWLFFFNLAIVIFRIFVGQCIELWENFLFFLGFVGSNFCRYYGTTVISSEERVLKLEEVEKEVKNANGPISEDEIEKIRREFHDAKQRFLKVPDAIKQMPKMNPEGFF